MYYFILNPVAGNGRLQSIYNKLKQRLISKNLLGEYSKTSGDGDAESLARIAIKKGYSTIICVGGDGTLNEIINGVAGYDVTIGLIPIGTINTASTILNISKNWEKSIDCISKRSIVSYDISKLIESRNYMFLSGGTGAETYLCMKSGEAGLMNSLFLKDNFVKDYANILDNSKPCKMRFIIDKLYSITMDVLSASVINSALFKKYYNIDNIFNFNDGLLELLVLTTIPNKSLIPNVLNSFEIYSGKYFTRILAREIHIESFEEQQKVHIDGRLISRTPCTFRINPVKQKFIVG